VIDNASERKEFSKLQELDTFGSVSIIRNNANSGFASANMIGAEHANARYYYFLNNDTLLRNDVLSILFEFMENNPTAGICSGQMYNEDGSIGINFNYFPDLKLKLLGNGLLRLINPAGYPKKRKEYKAPLEVPLLNGSSLFIPSDLFHNIGGFDTRFFLYCEEEDLALRMKKAGKKCFLIPEAGYIHLEGKSSIEDEGINYPMISEFYISQHYLYLKHYGKIAALIWRFSQFLRSFRKFYIHKDYIRLAFFILKGPDSEDSLINKNINQ
jgi:GT2 family glycosyltransferase